MLKNIKRKKPKNQNKNLNKAASHKRINNNFSKQ